MKPGDRIIFKDDIKYIRADKANSPSPSITEQAARGIAEKYAHHVWGDEVDFTLKEFIQALREAGVIVK